jgi:hypothetical protein
MQSQHTLHFSTIYVYIVMIVMDPLKPILNLCTLVTLGACTNGWINLGGT